MYMENYIREADTSLLYYEFWQILSQHELYYILHIDN